MEKLIKREQIAGMNIHYLFYSLEYFLDAQVKAGIKTIELWPGTPHFFLSYMEYSDCKKVRKLMDERNLTAKIITPENCTYQYQFAAQEKEQFEKSLGYFKKALDAGEELGVEIMAVNSGWEYWNEEREEAWKRSKEMLSILAEYAKTKNIRLAMESLRPQESNLATTVTDVKRMLDEVNHPNLKAMIDTTAMGVAGESIDQWFELLGEDIIHMHFIDGTPYGHLVWGDGNHSMEEFLHALNRHGYKGYLGQEITEFDYFQNPAAADLKNMKAYEPFIR